MAVPTRRPAALALALLLIAGLIPLTTASVAAEDGSVSAAEQTALTLTNKRRTDRGLYKLRLDARLANLARERAQYMADTGRFSHTQAGGTTVFDMIQAAGIRWYGAGEIIAWNTAGPLDYSASFAVQGWMGSSGHKAIVLSPNYNYVGFGLAIAEDGTRYWAGVYLRGPDRTGGYVTYRSFSKSNLDARWAVGTVRWSGNDTRLQVLTSGHRYFHINWRVAGGAWQSAGTTRATSLTKWWRRGWVYEVRIRERDRAGNWGAWTTRTLRP
jgi:uncharacterized protein YkwD